MAILFFDADYLIHQNNVKLNTYSASTPLYTTTILISLIERFANEVFPQIFYRFIDWIALFQAILTIFPGEITINIPNQDPSEKYTTFTINKTKPSNTIPLQFFKHGYRFQHLEQAILTQNWSWKNLKTQGNINFEQTTQNQRNNAPSPSNTSNDTSLSKNFISDEENDIGVKIKSETPNPSSIGHPLSSIISKRKRSESPLDIHKHTKIPKKSTK